MRIVKIGKQLQIVGIKMEYVVEIKNFGNLTSKNEPQSTYFLHELSFLINNH